MICVYSAGRLGNTIGDYAFALALQDRLGIPLSFPSLDQFGMFAIPWTLRLQNAANCARWRLTRRLKKPVRIDHFNPFEDYNMGNAVDNAYYCGYWSPMPYLGLLEARLRNLFRIRQNHIDKFRRRTRHVPFDRLLVIGVRGGDYKGWANLDGDYYEHALSRLRETAKTHYTMVVTDDPTHAYQVIPSSLHVDEVFSTTPEIDFQVVMSAKVAIIPNSTFHFWAAWLGKVPRVLAPTYFIGKPDHRWIPANLAKHVSYEWV